MAQSIQDMDMNRLWEILERFQYLPFYTAKGLEFYYTLHGGEMFVSRKDKSITRATIELAFRRVQEMDGQVPGPKKLNVFGASYLYPIFQKLGFITRPGEIQQ
ncbi:MAG: hypothetical protein LUG57_08410 [Oscillospiraceae bacterium]|nr:hypothetical protein [Oscillospiraceae bacterium]